LPRTCKTFIKNAANGLTLLMDGAIIAAQLKGDKNLQSSED